MKRRSLLGLLPASMLFGGGKAQGAVGDTGYTHLLLQFNAAYGEFFREYFGCVPNATDPSQCEGEQRGRIDYGSYIKCSKLVERIFPK